jgi:hypothetical protein
MGKPTSGILGCDALQGASDGFDESGLSTGLGAARPAGSGLDGKKGQSRLINFLTCATRRLRQIELQICRSVFGRYQTKFASTPSRSGVRWPATRRVGKLPRTIGRGSYAQGITILQMSINHDWPLADCSQCLSSETFPSTSFERLFQLGCCCQWEEASLLVSV